MIRVLVKRVAPNTWEATLVMQGDLVQAHAKALAPDKAEAVDRAAAIARQIASNPVLAAVMPPGTGAAIEATAKVAKIVKAGGPVASTVARMSGEGARRLARLLHF